MVTIHLHKLLFTGFHGLYEEEKILGTEYEVNIDIELVDLKYKIIQLHQTINYVVVYEIVKARMAKPSALLETVAQDLADLIHNASSGNLYAITVNIKKLHPPISNFEGEVGVSYYKEF